MSIERANNVAVILIHGIGDLEPDDVLSSASKSIRQLFPGIELSGSNGLSEQKRTAREKGEAFVDALEFTWENRRVRLIEFYWVQIPGKIRALHPLRALGQVLGTLKEFPSMSVGESTSPNFARLATYCGYAQQGLVLLVLLLSLIVILDGIRKSPTPDLLDVFATFDAVANRDLQGEVTAADTERLDDALGFLWTNYPGFVILVFVAPFVTSAWVILAIGCFAFPVVGIVRLRRWRQLRVLWRTVTVSSLLMVFAIWIIAFLAQWILIGVNELAATRLGQEGVLAMIILVVMFLGAGKVGLITANLLRDVVHYLATNNKGQPLATQKEIQDELWKVIQRLRQDGDFSKIVLVAHSLGTVILVDLLRNRAKDRPTDDVVHLDIVTAGSPLRRLIYRFLPDRLPSPAMIYNELTQSAVIKVDRWFNVYRIFDYVGQALTQRADPPQGIVDRPLLPRYRLPLGHANYWGDPRFVYFVATEVIGAIRVDPSEPNPSDQLTDTKY